MTADDGGIALDAFGADVATGVSPGDLERGHASGSDDEEPPVYDTAAPRPTVSFDFVSTGGDGDSSNGMGARTAKLRRARSSMINPKLDTDRIIKLATFAASFLYVVSAIAYAYVLDWRPTFINFLVVLLGLLVTPFFFTWLYLLVAAKEVYSVRVKTRRIADWLPAAVAYCRVVNEQTAMQSISEVSAIRGTVMSTALLNMSASIFTIGTVAVAYDIETRQSSLVHAFSSRDDAVALMLLMISIGTTFIANFEISKYDVFHSALHYFGLALALCGSFAYTVQEEFSYLSIALTAGQFAFAILWLGGVFLLPVKSADIGVVTFTSKFCVTTELGIFLRTVGEHDLWLSVAAADRRLTRRRRAGRPLIPSHLVASRQHAPGPGFLGH